jgi:hypothetical protein
MLRRKPQPAMVMTMKKTTSLNNSVAESEAKLEATACHPLVAGEATSTLMTRCLILAICSRNLRRTLFQKLSTLKAVKKYSTRIYQSTPYSSPHRISTSTYNYAQPANPKTGSTSSGEQRRAAYQPQNVHHQQWRAPTSSLPTPKPAAPAVATTGEQLASN